MDFLIIILQTPNGQLNILYLECISQTNRVEGL